MEVTIKPGETAPDSEAPDNIEVDAFGNARVTSDPEPAATDGEQEADEKPRKYAGKYDSVEDLEKAYLEAQKLIGQRGASKDSQGAEKKTEGSKIEDGMIPTDAPKDQTKVTLDDALREYAEKGEVSDGTFAKLEEIGLTRGHVERVIAAEKAAAERLVDSMAEQVGGMDALKSILEWARTGLSQEDVQAYNEAVQSGNATAVRMMLNGMKAMYEEAQGSDPNLIHGENTPAAGVRPFTHPDQIVEAMKDPRYEVDPEYTRVVDARLSISDII